jgi:preprotein translocase subunit SecG
MKRFTKIMSVLMVAIMLVCCFATVASAKNNEALGGDKAEANNTKKARQRVAESTSPT